jgi:PTS system nitrogen regulatory IIA component
MNEQSRMNLDNKNEIMTLVEIAKYLKVSQKTVLRLLKASDLPGGKICKQWRFQKTAIDNWMTSRIQGAANSDLLGVILTKKRLTPLPVILKEEFIIMDVEPGSKEGVLRQLIQPLDRASVLSAPEKYLADLIDRESMVSTALDHGIAYPHTRDQERTAVSQNSIVLGICPQGTDYEALDGQSTYLFFLICAQSTTAHLRLLSKITLLLRKDEVISRFRQCCTKKQVMGLLMDSHFDLSISF